MRRSLYLFTLILFAGNLFAQAPADAPLRPADLVQYHKNLGQQFTPVSEVLNVKTTSLRSHPAISAEVTEAVLLDFDQQFATRLNGEAPALISLSLPFEQGVEVEVELVKVDIFSENFSITTSDPVEIDWEMGTYYRGVIKDMEGSIAAVSVFDNEVRGMFSGPRIGNYVLGVLKNNNPDNTHILYNDHDLVGSPAWECHMEDDGRGYTEEELNGVPNTRALTDCINIYYEVDYDIYTDKGSGTTSWITGNFNEVATLYGNENLNYNLSQINIITSSGNQYADQSSSGMLSQFQSRYSGFNGDMAQMVSYKSSGGIAAGFDGICNSNPDNSMCFSGINSTYSTVPTYSWNIMVQTHELGHLNGSRHTHACVWNGNNTAIDGCYNTEGSCARPGNPSGGGTIMSYCHLQSVGINLANGFGPQPGNVIRADVTNGNCLSPCGGGGGGNGDPCTAQVSSFPYSEGFENTLGQWTQGSGDDFNWTLRSGGTPSSNTGPSSAAQGTYYVYVEASSPNYPSKVTYLNSPCFDLTGASEATVTFQYQAVGNSVGTCDLQASTDDGDSWTTVWTRSGSQGSAWTSQSVSLGSYLGGTVRLRYRGTTSTSWQGDMCVDDFELSTGGGGGGGGNCDAIDFNSYALNSYGGTQDNGSISLYGSGEGVVLTDNAWKSISLNYTVTSNTVIDFEFGSTAQGEIHGIGFDNNNSISSNYTIQVYGTQNWGNRTYDYTNPGYWQTFSVPIGQIYTGTFDRLFFTNDNDAGSGNNSYFRNIVIHEGNCAPSGLVATAGANETLLEFESEFRLDVYPNPMTNEFTTRLFAPEGDYEASIVDLSGRVVWQGMIPAFEKTHNLSTLPAGMYLLKVTLGDNEQLTEKIMKTR